MNKKTNFIYTKYFIYLIFILSFLALYSLSSQIIYHSKGKLRFLDEEKDNYDQICKENKDIYNYINKNKSLNQDYGAIDDKSKIILDFLDDDFKTKYIFKYIWNIEIFTFFIILLFIIIILSIYYSIASCVKITKQNCFNFFDFLFCKNKCFKRVSCLLIPIIYIVVLFLSFLGFIFADFYNYRLLNAFCFVENLIQFYNQGDESWAGFSRINSLFGDLENLTKTDEVKVKAINKSYNLYTQEWNNLIDYRTTSIQNNYKKFFKVTSPKIPKSKNEIKYSLSPDYAFNWTNILNEIYSLQENDVNEIEKVFVELTKNLYVLLGCNINKKGKITCNNESEIFKSFKSAHEIGFGINNSFSSIEEAIIKPIKNKENININILFILYSIMIAFSIFYSILIEVLLCIFCCSKKCKCCNKCVRFSLCFIYYTSIFVIIISFTFGIYIGFWSHILSDGTKIIQFIISPENLLADEPKIFVKNEYTKYFNICFNEEGDLFQKLGLVGDFEKINNIINISEQVENYIKKLENQNFTFINTRYSRISKLDTNHLSIKYYNIDDNSTISMADFLKEINKYVSGTYAIEKNNTCMINEIWHTSNIKSGYIYDNKYPEPNNNTNYLIYLYDKNLYKKVNFSNRYDNACPITGKLYGSVSEASQIFSIFFKSIRDNIVSDRFKKAYSNDLKQINNTFVAKNQYLEETLKTAIGPIKEFEKTNSKYLTRGNDISSYLNCKILRDDQAMVLDILYNYLGRFLKTLGLLTCLFSLFMFLGIVLILVVIKNSKLDEKNAVENMDLEVIKDILKGKDVEKEILSNDLAIQELMNI